MATPVFVLSQQEFFRDHNHVDEDQGDAHDRPDAADDVKDLVLDSSRLSKSPVTLAAPTNLGQEPFLVKNTDGVKDKKASLKQTVQTKSHPRLDF